MVKESNVVEPRKTRLTLQNLFAEGAEIWVVNRSAKKSGIASGPIMLQVNNGDMIESAVVPPGEDPICLTDQINPKLLETCMDLFKLVRSGALELLDPAHANDYYKQNQERKEIIEQKVTKFMNKEKDTNAEPKKVNREAINVNQVVTDVCLKAKHAAVTEREALERLREQVGILSSEDYAYLAVNGVHNGIKNWAIDQQSRLNNKHAQQ